MNSENPEVDFYFNKNESWQNEIKAMRELALACNLVEELKWGCPCYTFNKQNIVLIHVFKNYCAFLFFKGALLKDEKKLLIQQSENVQAGRQLRFTSIAEIKAIKAIIKAYIFEAIEIEKAGLKVELKKTKDFPVPEEFAAAIASNKELKKSFEALTPGRQRAYLLFFAAAKQAKTRMERINKNSPRILAGKGLDDK